MAHARDEARPGPPSPQKKAAPVGHVHGTWWMSSHALPGEVGYTMAAIIGVRPRNALS